MDAIISIPIAVLGFLFLPGSPLNDKKIWWLNDEEYALARERLERAGKKGRTKWTIAKFKRIVRSWHFWVLRQSLPPEWPISLSITALLYVIWNNAGVQNPMGYWLKSFNKKPHPLPGTTYTVSQINTRECATQHSWPPADVLVPLPGSAILIILSLAMAWLSDGPLRGRRWPFVYFNAIGIVRLILCNAHSPNDLAY